MLFWFCSSSKVQTCAENIIVAERISPSSKRPGIPWEEPLVLLWFIYVYLYAVNPTVMSSLSHNILFKFVVNLANKKIFDERFWAASHISIKTIKFSTKKSIQNPREAQLSGLLHSFNPRVTFLVRSQHSGTPFFRPKAGPYSVDWTFSACRIAKAPWTLRLDQFFRSWSRSTFTIL